MRGTLCEILGTVVEDIHDKCSIVALFENFATLVSDHTNFYSICKENNCVLRSRHDVIM